MAIRVQTKGSPVYHLQKSGQIYWLTRCGRAWMSPGFTDEDGCCFERLTIMPEISGKQARFLQLCKQCKTDWEQTFHVELGN